MSCNLTICVERDTNFGLIISITGHRRSWTITFDVIELKEKTETVNKIVFCLERRSVCSLSLSFYISEDARWIQATIEGRSTRNWL